MILITTRIARTMATMNIADTANESIVGSRKTIPKIPQIVAMSLRADWFIFEGLFHSPRAATSKRIPSNSLIIILPLFQYVIIFIRSEEFVFNKYFMPFEG
jgi:hypothetical protein